MVENCGHLVARKVEGGGGELQGERGCGGGGHRRRVKG